MRFAKWTLCVVAGLCLLLGTWFFIWSRMGPRGSVHVNHQLDKLLPKGMRAVDLSISQDTVEPPEESFFIIPGTHVDILDRGKEDAPQANVPDIVVVYVEIRPECREENIGRYPFTITVQATAEQARKLSAMKPASTRIRLRNPGG